MTEEIQSADALWQFCKHAIQLSLDKFVPCLLSRPKGRPCFPRSLLRDIRKRDRAYRVYRKYRTVPNLRSLELLKRGVKIQVSQAKTNFIEIHISDELKSGNTKPLYNFISKSRGKSNRIGCLNGIP